MTSSVLSGNDKAGRDNSSSMLTASMTTAIDQSGYAFLEGVFDRSDVQAFLSALGRAFALNEESVRSRSGVPYAARNVLELCPEVSQLWKHPLLVAVVRHILGENAGMIRALFLNKPPGDSWAVPWHKDLVVPVCPGDVRSSVFSSPTERAGIPHSEAPLSVLRKMLTLRIHLDDNDGNNGPLRVLPGSHKTGKTLVTEGYDATPIYARAGDVLVLRPLLAHKSGHVKEGTTAERRVLQLQFAATKELPDGFAWTDYDLVE